MTLILPKWIAHRGASQSAPENTLASLRQAKALGATWVEFDVQLTRDETAIIFHDAALQRTTNGDGIVAETDYEIIKTLDAGNWFDPAFKGERVPTLTDYLTVAAELGMGINVELKGNQHQSKHLARCVADALDKIWLDTLPPPLISSASLVCLQAMCDKAPHWPRGFIMDRWSNNWCDILDKLNCVSLHVAYNQLNTKRITAVKKTNKKLLAYTVNDTVLAKKLFEGGVDAVFSDNPNLFF